MADITGVTITDITQYGSAENGLKVWIKHALADGTEHIFIYPYEMVGHLIELLRKAANDSYSMRIARNPEAAQEGVISGVVPLKEIQVAASPEHDGPILQMLTADNIPVAFEAPWPLIESFSHQLPEALENMKKTPPQIPGGRQMH